MEEIDKIIFISLNDIQCAIDENITSLKSFTPELSVKAISKCLKKIKPDLEIVTNLPPGMAQRFSATTQLAEACTSIGFRGDIGYQTFLYSNEAELRRLLMWLIERLPKDETDKGTISLPQQGTAVIELDIARKIREQLKRPWLMEVQLSNDQMKTFYPSMLCRPDVKNMDISHIEYYQNFQPTIYQQQVQLLPSLIHTHDHELHQSSTSSSIIKKQITQLTQHSPSTSFNLNFISPKASPTKSADSEQKLEKPAIAPKPKSKVEILAEKAELLKAQIDEKLINQNNYIIQQARQTSQVELEAGTLEKLKNDKKIKERTSLLLDDPQSNKEKLESMIHVAIERKKQLETQWQDHQAPLQNHLDSFKDKNSDKLKRTQDIVDKVKTVKLKINEIGEDFKHKILLQQELTNELSKMNKNINRLIYTSRIYDIVGSIKKQKNDIENILRDTREVQKAINTLDGQLGRQFTVTDEMLFKTAKRDEHSKKAYKLLIGLHAEFNELIVLIESNGTISREIRDLEDQVEHERSQDIQKNLEQITHDLDKMEYDSETLEYKIKSMQE